MSGSTVGGKGSSLQEYEFSALHAVSNLSSLYKMEKMPVSQKAQPSSAQAGGVRETFLGDPLSADRGSYPLSNNRGAVKKRASAVCQAGSSIQQVCTLICGMPIGPVWKRISQVI